MPHAIDLIAQTRIVAIVRLADLSESLALTRALIAGGINAIEYTLTNRDALRALDELSRTLPEVARGEVTLGAGTVLTPEDADASINAGAQFIISPAINFKTIELCKKRNVPIMPGAYTPTEILNAWDAGATAVKVFPARALGANFIKDVREPLPFLKLIPTGGISADNVEAYLKAGAFALGVGGNLVDKSLVANRDWNSITQRAQTLIQQARNSANTK
jgi:2-dehydro-3-deoxyphosphogluconate aldolase/(4S)-4-hydroxy-2-oxoglutarate aldolase